MFLASHGLRASPALGQHFFIHRSMLQSIVKAAGFPLDETVIEIGPGIGHLTWTLLDLGYAVHAVEKDRRFAEMLTSLAERALDPNRRPSLLRADALETDFTQLQIKTGATGVIGNLPYNVAVPILFHVAYSGAPFKRLGFMVQKEVGERMAARSGEKPYGRLSIVLQYLYDIQPVQLIPPHAFFPAPKVESLFVTLTPRDGADPGFAKRFLERVAKIGFSHRRKKLRGVLRGAIIEKRVLDDAFLQQAADRFNFDDRAEHWPLETWIDFARLVESTPRIARIEDA